MNDEELLASLRKNERESTFEEIVTMGNEYYLKGLEIYCLDKAYSALIGFLLADEFEKCAVIKKSIAEFMRNIKKPNFFQEIKKMENLIKKHGL